MTLTMIYTIRNDENYTNQNLKYSLYNWYYYQTNNYSFKFNIKEKNIYGGNININYQINNNTSLSVTLSRGYKTSGINQSPNFSNYRYYNSEESINTELGLNYKNSMLKLNCSVFYMHRNNPQLRLFVQNNVNYPTYFDYATFNGSQSYLKGIESNLELHPVTL